MPVLVLPQPRPTVSTTDIYWAWLA